MWGLAKGRWLTQADASLMDILNELRAMRAEMKEDLNKVKKDVDTHTAELKNVNEKQTNLEDENAVLKQRISQLEDQNRRNNLIVGGLPETAGESWEATEEKVRDALVSDLHMDKDVVTRLSIDRAQRLGKRGSGNRVIKVTFINSKDKMVVLRKAREVKPDKPYIREDFSPSVLDARTKLKPGLLAARAEGLQAFLAHDKLIVQKDNLKNIYRYDADHKQVKAVFQAFDDGIEWTPTGEQPTGPR